MARTSDFVRPADVLDPERHPDPTEKVDYDGTGNRTRRRSAVTLVCVVGVLALAALQPHARNFPPAGGHSRTPAVSAKLQ